MPQHSLPTRIAGSPVRADDQDRLLEARVEAGQERDGCAVLAIGVDEEPVVAAVRHPPRGAPRSAPGSGRPGSPAGARARRTRAARARRGGARSGWPCWTHSASAPALRGWRRPRDRRRRAAGRHRRTGSRPPACQSPCVAVRPAHPDLRVASRARGRRGSSRAGRWRGRRRRSARGGHGPGIAGPDLDPRADRVAVRPRVVQPQREPTAHRRRRRRVPAADVRQTLDRRPVVDDDEIEQAVQVQVRDAPRRGRGRS